MVGRPILLSLSLILLAALGAAGCGTPLDGIRVANADLLNWGEFSLTALVGGRGVGADLEITEPDGTRHVFPASLVGVGAGALVDISIAGNNVIDCGGVSLGVPGEAVDGNALLGTYTGSNYAVGFGIGATGHDLENGDGVTLDAGHFGIVIGLTAGIEALVLSISEEE